MVEANFPINESGPSVLIISVATPKDAVPEIGLVKANGTISGGTFKNDRTGAINETNASMAPDALNILMETIIPNKKGSKEIASDTPSLPPSTNFS